MDAPHHLVELPEIKGTRLFITTNGKTIKWHAFLLISPLGLFHTRAVDIVVNIKCWVVQRVQWTKE